MKKQQILSSVLVLGLLLALAVGLSLAQGPEPPEGETGVEGEMDVAAVVPGAIPIQGRLTDKHTGAPLDGTYNLTFSLYEVSSGDTPLCSDTNSVVVEDGLFSTYMDYCYNDLYGQKVWLGIEVGSDGEMTDRQVIYPVPYALSLRPGAVISDSRDGILTVRSTGSGDSDAFFAYAGGTGEAVTGEATDGIGVYGKSINGNGVHGFTGSGSGVFGGSLVGIGVTGSSIISAAIRAEGTGIIQSTAKSYVFVPGAHGVLHGATTGATLKHWGQGDVSIESTTDGTKDIVFPVTLPAVLYGQQVRVEAIAFTFKNTGDLTGISRVYVYRTRTDGTYRAIVDDATGWTGLDWTELTFPSSTDNVLASDDGQLAVRVTCFIPAGSKVEFTGVRVRLGHDE